MEHLQREWELFVSQITTEVALVDIKNFNKNKAAGRNHTLISFLDIFKQNSDQMYKLYGSKFCNKNSKLSQPPTTPLKRYFKI